MTDREPGRTGDGARFRIDYVVFRRSTAPQHWVFYGRLGDLTYCKWLVPTEAGRAVADGDRDDG